MLLFVAFRISYSQSIKRFVDGAERTGRKVGVDSSSVIIISLDSAFVQNYGIVEVKAGYKLVVDTDGTLEQDQVSQQGVMDGLRWNYNLLPSENPYNIQIDMVSYYEKCLTRIFVKVFWLECSNGSRININKKFKFVSNHNISDLCR